MRAAGGRPGFGRPCAAERRTPAERRAARRRAAASADGAIARLSRLLAEERAAAAAWGSPGVRERLQAAAPALADLCRGRPVAPAARLHRNVAMHAAVLLQRGAPLSVWRQAQRGPRLEAVIPAHDSAGPLAASTGALRMQGTSCDLRGPECAAEAETFTKEVIEVKAEEAHEFGDVEEVLGERADDELRQTLVSMDLKAELLQKFVHVLNDVCHEVNFECTDKGLEAQSMDTGHVALVSLRLRETAFAEFKCERPAVLGMNVELLSKILGSCNPQDTLKIRWSTGADSVSFQR